jgi:hypothetical protein
MLEKEKRAYLFRHAKNSQDEVPAVEEVKVIQNKTFFDTVLDSVACLPQVHRSDQKRTDHSSRSLNQGDAEHREDGLQYGGSRKNCDVNFSSRFKEHHESAIDRATNFTEKQYSPNAANSERCNLRGVSPTNESQTQSVLDGTRRLPTSNSVVFEPPPEHNSHLTNAFDRRIASADKAAPTIPSSDPVEVVKSHSGFCAHGLIDTTLGAISSTAYQVSNSANYALNGLAVCGVEVPAAVEETAVRVPRSRSLKKLQSLTRTRTKTQRQSPAPAINHSNSLREHSPFASETARPKPTPNSPKMMAAASVTRKVEKAMHSSRDHDQRSNNASPTKRRTRSTSDLAKNGLPTIPPKPIAKSRPSRNSIKANQNRTMKHNEHADRNTIVLPPLSQKLLPDSIAKTVKTSNVRPPSVHQAQVRKSSTSDDFKEGSGQGEKTPDTAEGIELNFNGRHPTREMHLATFAVPLGLHPHLSRRIINQDQRLPIVKDVSRTSPPKRKAKLARDECLELVLAPSLEGTAIVKRRSSFKQKNNRQRSFSLIKTIAKCDGRQSPSRGRVPDPIRRQKFESRYADF